MSQVITSIEQVTPQWLGMVTNCEISSIRIEEIGPAYGKQKWRLTATCADGSARAFFLKMGQSRPHEAHFYQATKGVDTGLPVVPCYDVAIHDEESHFLLKDLSETHEARPPSQFPPNNVECERIIDGLADLHGHWWDHPQLQTTFGGTPSESDMANWLAKDMKMYRRFAGYLGDRLPDEHRAIYQRVGEKLPAMVIERFRRGKLTLIFEDVHSGNFLYPRDPQDKLYFIDWEQWGVNLAMNDLAYMIALFWSPQRRARLEKPYLERYHKRLVARGVSYHWDELWYDYRLCVMRHLFIPAWQFVANHIPDVWWNHYERITAAYIDLNCDELLPS